MKSVGSSIMIKVRSVAQHPVPIVFLLFLGICISSGQAVAQEIKNISGKVFDGEANSPLPGATVLIKGTTTGTTTDFDGNFKLSTSIKNPILAASYIGLQTKEVVIGNKTEFIITLMPGVSELEEVVITTGYDKVSKKTFTGASSTVDMKDVKINGITDVTRMLEGRSAGVTVQNVSGTFGSAPRVTIRGSSSIFGINAPLYVIDGIVQEDIIESDISDLVSGNASNLISSSIAGLNASDIKKIDILKDASATSLYGARARNGVIVITTKRGIRETPLQVSYNTEFAVRDIPSYSNYDILNSKDNISVLKEMEDKGFLELTNVLQARRGGVYYLMADRLNRIDPDTGAFFVKNTPEDRNKFLQQYELANTNWFDVLFRHSLTQDHTLSLKGGGKDNAFYVSVGFFSDPGWSIAESVRRVSTTLKNTFYFTDKLSVSLSSVASIRKQKAPGTFGRKVDKVNGSISRTFDINPFSYALNTSRTLRPKDNKGNLEYYRNNWAPFNILKEIENNYIDLNMKDIKFQADVSYRFSDKISYNLSTAFRYVNSVREHKINGNSNVASAYRAMKTTIERDSNVFLYKDPNRALSAPVSVLPKGGIYNKDDNYLTSYYIRNSIDYKDTFSEDHDVSVLLGQESRYIDRDHNFFKGYGLQYIDGYVSFTDPRAISKVVEEENKYFSVKRTRERTAAFFLKASYAYKKKYVFSVTGRLDGSNSQGATPNSRWLPTYTVSAKWNVSDEETFIASAISNTVSNLQLRTSYGLVATPGPATNSLAIFKRKTTDRLLISDRESYLDIEDLKNANLTWEKQYEFNFGIDIGLFDNKLSMTIDAYSRKIFDNIDYVKTSGIGGEYIKLGNNADVTMDGIELGLSTVNMNFKDFKWSTSFNFSYFKQKIIKLQNEPRFFDLVSSAGGNLEGFPINSLFSFKFEGLDDRGIPTFLLPEDGPSDGSVNFQYRKDYTKYLVYEGAVSPNVTMGLSNTFIYKNWSMDVFITGAGGNKIRLNPTFRSSYTDTDVFSKDFINRWILPRDEKITNIPAIIDKRITNDDSAVKTLYAAYNYSNVRVANGDFVRLKNISLGYSLDKKLIKKIGLSNLNIKFQATNVFLLYADSKLNGQDPEFYRTGGVALPIRRQYTLSLNIGI